MDYNSISAEYLSLCIHTKEMKKGWRKKKDNYFLFQCAMFQTNMVTKAKNVSYTQDEHQVQTPNIFP